MLSGRASNVVMVAQCQYGGQDLRIDGIVPEPRSTPHRKAVAAS
jgi:hypothetical protein